jgi:hypothetical protein
MLTKDQIEAAGRELDDLVYFNHAKQAAIFSTVLAAYERVTALLGRWEAQVRMEVANRQTQLMAGDLRRALEG